jgi:hypothetical protein
VYLDLHRSSFQEFVAESDPAGQQKLFFTEKDFSKINWFEKDREFEWNGKMYDVSSIEKIKEGYHILCVNDEQEESFLALFDSWKKSNTPTSKAKIIFQPQFCSALLFENSRGGTSFKPDFSFIMRFYNPPFDKAPSPPPRVSFLRY